MARGVKKSLQEKIAQKEELIEALSTRIKKENALLYRINIKWVFYLAARSPLSH